jgi:hypothetical protein
MLGRRGCLNKRREGQYESREAEEKKERRTLSGCSIFEEVNDVAGVRSGDVDGSDHLSGSKVRLR